MFQNQDREDSRTSSPAPSQRLAQGGRGCKALHEGVSKAGEACIICGGGREYILRTFQEGEAILRIVKCLFWSTRFEFFRVRVAKKPRNELQLSQFRRFADSVVRFISVVNVCSSNASKEVSLVNTTNMSSEVDGAQGVYAFRPFKTPCQAAQHQSWGAMDAP